MVGPDDDAQMTAVLRLALMRRQRRHTEMQFCGRATPQCRAHDLRESFGLRVSRGDPRWLS
jgi:hypothetical protein